MRISDLTVAAHNLAQGHSLIIINDGTVVATYQGKGIGPMLAAIAPGQGCLQGCLLGDQVIGKAAALLAIYGGVKVLYTPLISVAALSYLENHNIGAIYRRQVNTILNRTQTDSCPMEKLVMLVSDPAEAKVLIEQKLMELRTAEN